MKNMRRILAVVLIVCLAMTWVTASAAMEGSSELSLTTGAVKQNNGDYKVTYTAKLTMSKEFAEAVVSGYMERLKELEFICTLADDGLIEKFSDITAAEMKAAFTFTGDYTANPATGIYELKDVKIKDTNGDKTVEITYVLAPAVVDKWIDWSEDYDYEGVWQEDVKAELVYPVEMSSTIDVSKADIEAAAGSDSEINSVADVDIYCEGGVPGYGTDETINATPEVSAVIKLDSSSGGSGGGSSGGSGGGGSGGSGGGSSGGSGGGGSTEPEAPTTPTVPEVDVPAVDTSAPTVSTETVEKEDGSTTTTETKEDGVVVETTTNADGSKTETATKTETVETEEGTTTTTNTTTTTETSTGEVITENKKEVVVETEESKTTTTTSKTETVDAAGQTTTETKVQEKVETAEGTTATTTTTTETAEKTETVEVKEETVIAEDGTETTTTTSKTETALANGSTGTTVVDEAGQVTAEVIVTDAAVQEAAAAGTAVALPMPPVAATTSSVNAPTITVKTESGEAAKVEIPVEEVSAGAVVVIVNEDGSEQVVTKTAQTENGLAVEVPDGATVKVVDNSKSFADADTHWGKSAIDFATSRELFDGVSDNEFDPNGTMTRAMLVTVLYRLEGEPEHGGHDHGFEDVAHDKWYSDAVAWANELGIVEGDGTGFDPNGEVTREQIAVILHRYAEYVDMPTHHDGDLEAFHDHHETSDWAREAKDWAVGAGLITGKDGNRLDPTGDATRAEVATILERLVGLLME